MVLMSVFPMFSRICMCLTLSLTVLLFLTLLHICSHIFHVYLCLASTYSNIFCNVLYILCLHFVFTKSIWLVHFYHVIAFVFTICIPQTNDFCSKRRCSFYIFIFLYFYPLQKLAFCILRYLLYTTTHRSGVLLATSIILKH
jgi:hypothetical protein